MTGSCVRIPGVPDLSGGFAIGMWVLPTLHLREPQGLATIGDVALELRDGRVTLGDLVLDPPLALRTWAFVSASVAADGRATLAARPQSELHGGPARRAEGTVALGAVAGELLLGHRFNGKLDAPRLFARAMDADQVEHATGELARWDFGLDIPTSRVTDVAGDLHGATLQRPMRGATGHDWDGTEVAWPHARSGYGAIHFHDDDLDDAGWEPSFSWTVPDDTPSGVYAAHLRTGDAEDFVPFTVRPRAGRPTSDVAVLLPTFSYLAYANEQLLAGGRR